MRCRDIRPLLPDHATGMDHPSDHARVVEHLRSCAACAAEAQRFRALVANMPRESATLHLEDPQWSAFGVTLNERIDTLATGRRPWWSGTRLAIAGAAAVVLLLGTLLLLPREHTQDDDLYAAIEHTLTAEDGADIALNTSEDITIFDSGSTLLSLPALTDGAAFDEESAALIDDMLLEHLDEQELLAAGLEYVASQDLIEALDAEDAATLMNAFDSQRF